MQRWNSTHHKKTVKKWKKKYFTIRTNIKYEIKKNIIGNEMIGWLDYIKSLRLLIKFLESWLVLSCPNLFSAQKLWVGIKRKTRFYISGERDNTNYECNIKLLLQRHRKPVFKFGKVVTVKQWAHLLSTSLAHSHFFVFICIFYSLYILLFLLHKRINALHKEQPPVF